MARDNSESVVLTYPKSSTPAPAVPPASYSPLPSTSATPDHIFSPPQLSAYSATAEEPSTSNTTTPAPQETTLNSSANPTTSNRRLNDKGLTRHRQRNEDQWKRTVAKESRQSGKEYTSQKSGTLMPAKQVDYSKNCKLKECKFQCQRKISKQTQDKICEQFWSLGSEIKQKSYYDKTITEVQSNQRQRSGFKGKRSVTRKLHLQVDDKMIQVCQRFYTSTLVISKSRIATFFQTRDKHGNPGERTRHEPWNKTPSDLKNLAREHIASIPRVKSHYVRATSNRDYVDATLNITKLYKLYKEWCATRGVETVSEYVYSDIINNETNLAFHKPKADLCDKCTMWDVKEANGLMTEEDIRHQKLHDNSREKTMNQRATDMADLTPEKLVISYDLENVFSLPRTAVSSAYYKSKLNTYNLTAIVGRTKKGYCSIWSEDRGGRSGNDIASAIVNNLERIVKDHPEASDLILWSDSCVPQNRNSNMTYAVQKFVETQPHITSVTHRFSEPGHSSIQDVDNLHSLIERNLKGLEIHSPITLVRHLKTMQCNGQKMDVKILDGDRHFFDYASCSKQGNYKRVPYASVKELIVCSSSVHTVRYKTCFSQAESAEADVLQKRVLRNGNTKSLTTPALLTAKDSLSEKKVADILLLVIYMSDDDKAYMTALWQKYRTSGSTSKKSKRN